MDFFSPHEDHYNLIDYMLRGFILFASINLNPLGIFMYIALSMDSYKYVLTTFMRLTSSPSETIKALSYKYSFVPNKLYTFRLLEYKSRKLLVLLIIIILHA